MATVGELVVSLSANTAALESGITRAERRVGSFGTAAKDGFRKTEAALVDLGLRAAGLEGSFGRLTEGMLLLGTGGAATAAVTGGMAAIGLAIRAVNAAADEQSTKIQEIQRRYAGFATSAARATRTQMELDRAMLEGRLQSLNRNPLPNNMEGWDRLFRSLGKREGSQQSAIRQVVGDERQSLLEAIAAVDTALQELDKRTVARSAVRTQALVADMQRIRAAMPDRLVAFADSTRQGASAAEQAAMINATGGVRSTAMIGVGGESGQSPYAAMTEAAAQREQELASMSRAAMTEQTRLAAFTEAAWQAAAERIQGTLADTFEGLFTAQEVTLHGFAQRVVQTIEQMLAQIAAAQVANGLSPVLSGLFGAATGAAGGIPGAPDSSFLGGANAGIPLGLARRGPVVQEAPTVIHQTINYAPAVTSMDAQDTERFFKKNRGVLANQMARMAQDSDTVARSLRGRSR